MFNNKYHQLEVATNYLHESKSTSPGDFKSTKVFTIVSLDDFIDFILVSTTLRTIEVSFMYTNSFSHILYAKFPSFTIKLIT